MKFINTSIKSLILGLAILEVHSATVKVDVNIDMVHSVNGVSQFDRSRFVTLHADNTDIDFNNHSAMMKYLMDTLDVYFGRTTGSMKWALSQVGEDPNRAGYANPAEMVTDGDATKKNYGQNKVDRHVYEKKQKNLIVGAQVSGYYPGSGNAGSNWAFSTAEPFGKPTGEFMSRWLQNFFGTGGSNGMPSPGFVEVMNEPIWPLVEKNHYGGGTIENIFKLHNNVADEIKARNPNALVGGYTTAFPDFWKNDFQQWEDRWKRFIDECGEKMDFYSIHLYDFPGIGGGKRWIRSGSHMEATMDMLQHYAVLQGKDRPLVISEYGAAFHDIGNDPWSSFRDWQSNIAQNAMLMQFLERPDYIAMAIPFNPLKAEWGRKASLIPLSFKLEVRQKWNA